MLQTGFFPSVRVDDPVYRSRSPRDSARPAIMLIMLIMLYFLGFDLQLSTSSST